MDSQFKLQNTEINCFRKCMRDVLSLKKVLLFGFYICHFSLPLSLPIAQVSGLQLRSILFPLIIMAVVKAMQ